MSSKSIETTLNPDTYWDSINILVSKPHVINKRLWGSKLWFRCSGKQNVLASTELLTISPLSESVTDDNIEIFKNQILKDLNIDRVVESEDIDNTIEVLLIELLPKNYSDSQAYQIVCLQKEKSTVTFYNVTPLSLEQKICPDFSYCIFLSNNQITLRAKSDETSKSYKWLANTLLPQLIKWGTNPINDEAKTNVICSESLSLVSQTKYYEKYNDLKIKYGKEMVKIWPECTDATKFVYEDVAIAAYLLLLWEDETGNKKSFVDLGCGNGLLVYILTKEGHTGIGLDVRKRNIWDMYPSDVILQEKTITPSDASIFPDMDWIIGNHSDELTPWIPVIAAKSSYKCNFFLLPCCAYNFDGTKYQRKNSYKSQYNDYLDHIKHLCEDCGFKIGIDRLKIPSTKRICLVSSSRIYPEEEYTVYCNKIDEIISKDSSNTSHNINIDKEFKAREPVERVRNCTQIDKGVVDSIVECISRYLLEGCTESDPKWSIGRKAEFNELVQLIPQEHLNILKSECGGIQTLLKNNHNIFEVQSGKVGLRYPKTINEVVSNSRKRKLKQMPIKVQQKKCWFYNNHPQGCPLSDENCSFLHVKIR
ncbi:probable tRNA (uracil-O(2)-)-methyltransferase [Helicoverpa zea]|uniref:probable tRNA (uracil-O(2)-)-methyltransferase n=1 Tax=Helicoverpa zea TaxID=7113 RepID=UPI001F5927A3|nr:probable tRNA (uracil-O(2)-)-methyltransferase [Helicoverpa zea]